MTGLDQRRQAVDGRRQVRRPVGSGDVRELAGDAELQWDAAERGGGVAPPRDGLQQRVGPVRGRPQGATSRPIDEHADGRQALESTDDELFASLSEAGPIRGPTGRADDHPG